MMIQHLKTTIVMAVLVVSGLNAKAQVTIGSLNDPQKGVLLELKTQEAKNPQSVTDDENVTVDATGGGLLFPRVKLVSKNTLEPFIDSKNSQEWTSHAKLTHAGMVVYNLHVSDDFQLGLYVWDGAEWTKISDSDDAGKDHYFLIPSFNIELREGDNQVNFYDEYKKQFSNFVSSNSSLTKLPSHPSGRLYRADELDYVITYYDSNIIKIISLGSDGWFKFRVRSLDLDANSFINVIAIVK